jgi:hypothetical protein
MKVSEDYNTRQLYCSRFSICGHSALPVVGSPQINMYLEHTCWLEMLRILHDNNSPFSGELTVARITYGASSFIK